MINLEIREFSQAIINFINRSPLPTEVKRLCLNDISVQLLQTANTQIETEIQVRDRQAENDNPEQEEKNEFIKNSSKNPLEKQDGTGTKREKSGTVRS
ncbi:MAG: hypothetical protein OSJ71_01080 [Acetatifactor sp.]|nr:hypothetical protein [Acetatifactor sp.]